jgi:hypothetical protein
MEVIMLQDYKIGKVWYQVILLISGISFSLIWKFLSSSMSQAHQNIGIVSTIADFLSYSLLLCIEVGLAILILNAIASLLLNYMDNVMKDKLVRKAEFRLQIREFEVRRKYLELQYKELELQHKELELRNDIAQLELELRAKGRNLELSSSEQIGDVQHINIDVVPDIRS